MEALAILWWGLSEKCWRACVPDRFWACRERSSCRPATRPIAWGLARRHSRRLRLLTSFFLRILLCNFKWAPIYLATRIYLLNQCSGGVLWAKVSRRIMGWGDYGRRWSRF